MGDEHGMAQVSYCEGRTIYFMPSIPSMGYCTYWYAPFSRDRRGIKLDRSKDWILDSGYLRVEVCSKTGTLKSAWSCLEAREILSGAGNQLQFFQDQGQYWDAWNIDPNYAQHPLESATLKKIEWISTHPLRQRLRVVLQWRQSIFTQDYILAWGSSVLNIETHVDWQETHVLVKAAFPLNFSADYATYETPCGAIDRPTLPNPQPLTEHEKAKWEVPALHWADLTQSGEKVYGVSLLNDCKYGYDAQPDCLRLTLLRSPLWPDEGCDRGSHSFTYALYSHSGSWQQAKTHQKGYELNRPLIAQTVALSEASLGRLDQERSFLSGFPDNLVLMALKQSEDSPQHWIVRAHEACGQPAIAKLETTLPIQPLEIVDGLEHPVAQVSDEMRGWEVRSQRWG